MVCTVAHFRASVGCKKTHFVGSNVSFSLMLFYTYIINQASNVRLTDSMWPAQVFHAACNAFWKFSNDQHLCQ